ncbi:hypothetical protein [uncultured Imperialibacter sp.]|uniref:hypothetical protein n=1 Tax=uncultured Imperialibacter sp. TaxID=1672639 RepID=UPI0030D88F6F|tara:strand:+ start:69103 stop:71643 length:2541 start_codon:yes stop_codon:yes gene_type:complete
MSRLVVLALVGYIMVSCSGSHEQSQMLADSKNLGVKRFNNITLELSLKPFKKNDKQYIEDACKEIFAGWGSLVRHADTVSLMLWTADGSEILDYSGSLDQRLEWARYIGNPNAEHEVNSEPENENLSVHQRAFTYLDDTPDFNYGDLKYIVSTLKRVGETMTGKPVRVGATFDPGPEFAKSPFKYEKHPEICMGSTMGSKTFVVCYSTLNEDSDSYAGFPNGIKQDTPFGTFFGSQSQHFLTDLGFDYLWLSNGFGFGMETWSATGALFDGEKFYPEKFSDVQEKIVNFWTLFREQCPDFRIETRGTNLSTGIDLAADGVDLKSIYNGGFNLLPPPNSPWAALNGDFGLELAGYMSRIAELPDDRYLFRYYTHDPWWVNSPWLDRYGREAHDIYLPMSISTINSKGEAMLPTHLNFLTIDDSYGNMPVQVPDEVTPHILQARRNAPDQAGPVVWVYPFDEYHEWASVQPERLPEIYYGDWFIRQAINEGFPMNTVVSTGNFSQIRKDGKPTFDESVLVTIVPDAGSELEQQLMAFVKAGGQLMIYGPVGNGSKEFLDFMNIKAEEPLAGEFAVQMAMNGDNIETKSPMVMQHPADLSGGGIETMVAARDNYTKVLAQVVQSGQKRDAVVYRQSPDWKGGAVCYVRGTNSVSYKGGHLLTPDDSEKWFSGPSLMRFGLGKLGYSITYDKSSGGIKDPINCISRHNNSFFFSGYLPNLTVEQAFKFPQGAPIIIGWETQLKNGASTYRFPKSFFEESRFFVEQEDGVISCFDIPLATKGTKRRIQLTGLKNAKVRFYPPTGVAGESVKVVLNSSYPFGKGQLEGQSEGKFGGDYYLYENVTGQLVVSW